MALQDVSLVMDEGPVPADVYQLLAASQSGVSKFLERRHRERSGFVPSNPERVYRALRGVADNHFFDGISFCEWGSGYGTATCLAATLGFDACGIEIEPQLVQASRKFAARLESSAVFAEGSFVPASRRSLSVEAFFDNEGRYPWLKFEAHDAYKSLGRELVTFDVVFAYPWPGEEYFVNQLFYEMAGEGALLMSYSDRDQVTLLRKTARSTV